MTASSWWLNAMKSWEKPRPKRRHRQQHKSRLFGRNSVSARVSNARHNRQPVQRKRKPRLPKLPGHRPQNPPRTRNRRQMADSRELARKKAAIADMVTVKLGKAALRQ